MNGPTKYEVQGLVEKNKLSLLDVAIILGLKTKSEAKRVVEGEIAMDRRQWESLVRHVSDTMYGSENGCY